jgi:cytochrome c peroxidase
MLNFKNKWHYSLTFSFSIFVFSFSNFALIQNVYGEKLNLKLNLEKEKNLLDEAKTHFEPLPPKLIDEVANAKLIELGKSLFNEKALSKSGTISCQSCHMLENFGVDNLPTSPGHSGIKGNRNSPSVYNAALQFAQFWDGRAENVEEQALGPLLNPIEHGLKDEQEALKILSELGYQTKFKEAFPKEEHFFTFKNLGRSIGAFEKTLLTPSRFDDYLRGDYQALSQAEKKGMKRFIDIGCVTCHSGVGVGGGMFQKLGLMEEYKPNTDKGRSLITKNPDDDYFFKVASLRNVEKTAPYFHDGSLKNLEAVIPIMAKFQLGEKVSAADIQDIKLFLKSLTAKKLP